MAQNETGCFHLPGFHFGSGLLSHSHLGKRVRVFFPEYPPKPRIANHPSKPPIKWNPTHICLRLFLAGCCFMVVLWCMFESEQAVVFNVTRRSTSSSMTLSVNGVLFQQTPVWGKWIHRLIRFWSKIVCRPDRSAVSAFPSQKANGLGRVWSQPESMFWEVGLVESVPFSPYDHAFHWTFLSGARCFGNWKPGGQTGNPSLTNKLSPNQLPNNQLACTKPIGILTNKLLPNQFPKHSFGGTHGTPIIFSCSCWAPLKPYTRLPRPAASSSCRAPGAAAPLPPRGRLAEESWARRGAPVLLLVALVALGRGVLPLKIRVN